MHLLPRLLLNTGARADMHRGELELFFISAARELDTMPRSEGFTVALSTIHDVQTLRFAACGQMTRAAQPLHSAPLEENFMKATQLLKSQHDEVKGLFKSIEKTLEKGGDASPQFEELARKLVAHDAIERELFYPACEEVDDVEDLLGESLVEHGLVEFSLYQADVSLGDEHFMHKCTVLKEVLEHHIEEEEKELFPKVESALGAEKLEQLGTQMSARFEEVRKTDFRGPLFENLQQVLSGKVDLEEEDEEEAASAPSKQKSNAKRGNSVERARPRS